MASESIRDQWYLEVKGQKFGPYSLAQLKSLAAREGARMEDRVTAEHLCGKWIALGELMHKNTELTVPPRPDEKTLLSISTPLQRVAGNDPVDNLFNVVQSARERNPVRATHFSAVQPVMEIRSARSLKRFWALAPVAAAGIAAVFGMTHVLHSKLAKSAKPGAKRELATFVAPETHFVSPTQAKFTPPVAAAHVASTAKVAPATYSTPAIDDSQREREREHERQQAEAERDRELAELERENFQANFNANADRNPATAPEEEDVSLQADQTEPESEQAPADGSLAPLAAPQELNSASLPNSP